MQRLSSSRDMYHHRIIISVLAASLSLAPAFQRFSLSCRESSESVGSRTRSGKHSGCQTYVSIPTQLAPEGFPLAQTDFGGLARSLW
jgi:hypothetical protein